MPRGPQPDRASFADLAFPVAGIDTSTEFGLQQPGTTPEAQNVRGYEALTARQRGGSRPGLSRYISTQVGGVESPIQHLAVIVDPTPRGLHAYGDPGTYVPGGGIDITGGGVIDTGEGTGRAVPDPGTTTDPSTNNGAGGYGPRNNGNRQPRDGGSGEQPNRHLPPPPPPPPPVAYVQSVYGPVPGTYTPGFSDFGFASGSARRTVTLPSHVSDGHFLLAAVATATSGVSATSIQVRSAALSTYTQAGTAASYLHFGITYELSLWFRIATGGTLEDAVHVDPAVACAVSVALLEFKNVLAPVGASLDAFAKRQGVSTPFPLQDTDTVTVALAGDLLVGAFSDDSNDTVLESAVAAGSGFTLLLNQYDGTDMPSLQLVYQVGPAASAAAVLDATVLGGNLYSAAGATFKKA